MLNVNNLPDELLLKVFSMLDLKDLCICSQVCWKWNHLSKDFSVLRNVKIYTDLSDEALFTIISNYCSPSLEIFDLRMSNKTEAELSKCEEKSISQKTIQKLFDSSSKLKKLTLSGCYLHHVFIPISPSNITHLSTRSSLINPYLFFGSKIGIHLPMLTCLDLGAIQHVTSEDLASLTKLKSLRSLYMDGCHRVNNGGIESLIDILPQLHVFDIERTDVSVEGIKIIFKHCTSLKELYIGGTALNDNIFIPIKRNITLSILCLLRTGITSRNLYSFLNNCIGQQQLIVIVDNTFNKKRHSPSFNRNNAPLSSPPNCKIKIEPFSYKSCLHIFTHKC